MLFLFYSLVKGSRTLTTNYNQRSLVFSFSKHCARIGMILRFCSEYWRQIAINTRYCSGDFRHVGISPRYCSKHFRHVNINLRYCSEHGWQIGKNAFYCSEYSDNMKLTLVIVPNIALLQLKFLLNIPTLCCCHGYTHCACFACGNKNLLTVEREIKLSYLFVMYFSTIAIACNKQ